MSTKQCKSNVDTYCKVVHIPSVCTLIFCGVHVYNKYDTVNVYNIDKLGKVHSKIKW